MPGHTLLEKNLASLFPPTPPLPCLLAPVLSPSLSPPSLLPFFFHSFHASGHLRSELFFFPGSMTDTLCGVQGLVISIIKKKKKENQYRRGGQSMAGSDHEWARGVV